MDRNGERTKRRERARDILREELRGAVGDDAAARAEREGALDAAADGDRPRTVATATSQSRMLNFTDRDRETLYDRH